MKNLIRFTAALVATWLPTMNANSAQTNCTVLLRAIDSGYYDRNGERDPRIKAAVAGFSAQAHARGPFRGFVVFDVLNFPGTVTNANLFADVYSISPDGSETLELRAVTSPITAVRDGGFGLNNIYTDLADGTLYGSATYSSGYHYGQSISLNASALADINAARGNQFAFGGALADANSDPVYNEMVDLLSYMPDRIMLRLEMSVPVEPIIYLQPPGLVPFTYSNAAFFTVGACGAPPLDYYWFVDGVTDGARSYPDFYMQTLMPTPQSVFVVISNAYGSVTSIVSQAQARPAVFNPSFTNLTVRVGEHVFINSGFAVFSFHYTLEWRKNGAPLPYSSPYSYEISGAQFSDAGDYTIAVSNSFGVVTSAVMRLQVVETPPVFWQEPFDQHVPLGSLIYLSAEARGGPPPVLRWYREGTPAPINGSNDFIYIQNISNMETGRYYVVASNSLGAVTSHVANITTYLDPPSFTRHPQSQVAYPGNAVVFEANADGNPYPDRQWYFNGVPIQGEWFSQLWRYNVSSNDAGAYFMVASNGSGAVTSQIATLSVPYVPPVLSGPDDVTVGEGSSASLFMRVSNPPVHVRWRLNGTNIPGSDSAVIAPYANFFVNTSDTNKAGLYSAIASNAYGFTTSRLATLTITSSPPTVILLPPVRTVLEGAKIEFTVIAGGAPSPQVALYHAGTNTGAPLVNQKFTLPSVTLADGGDYTAVASNRVGVAVSGVARLDVQRAGPLDRWNVRSPIPQGNDLLAVTYGGGKFVAVGRNGALISSADGTNWNTHALRTTAELQDVTYGNGRFVTVGEGSLVVTSTNGVNWSIVPMDPGLELFAATYGNGRFVAVGRPNFVASPVILLSSNGLDWVDATFLTPSALWLRGVAYGAGAFVTLDAGGQVLRSTDLANWSSTTNNLNASESLKFLNGAFFITGSNGRIVKSSDGVSWTMQTVDTLRLYDTAYGNGTYVAVGARGLIMRSENTGAWTPVSSSTVNRLEGVVYGNELFVAVGESGTILTSSDGQSWGNQIRVTGEDLDGMTVGGGLAVAVGKNDTILTSSNGRDWTQATVPPTTNSEPRDWHGIGYGDGKFVAVGQTKDILVSTNGVDWEVHGYETTVSSPYLKSVAYAAGAWVAVGEQGELITSPDAVAWLPFDSTVPYDLNEVTYGNGMFVVVGDRSPNPDSTILTSTNGTNWIDRSISTGKNARGIGFANGQFNVTLNDGRIIYSTDPNIYNWYQFITGAEGEGHNLRGITWSNSVSVAVGNLGLILANPDGSSWRTRITPTEENLHAVRYINGTFVAVGNGGTILQSDPLVSQLHAGREGTNLRLTFSSPYEGSLKLQYANEFMPFPPANPWQDLAFITNVVGTVDYLTPLPPGTAHKFYRVVAP